MKKKSLVKNYIYNLTYQVLILILPLVTTPYVARVLGAENVGIYGYTLSISAFFILFGNLGIHIYGQREIAYLQDDRKKYSKVFWEILIFRFITMALSMIVFYIVFILFNNEYDLYYRILMLELIGKAIDICWFFQGLEEFKKTVTRNLLIKLTSVVCVFIFVKTRDDLITYFWIYALSVIIGNGSLWIKLGKYLDKVSFKELNVFKHFKPTFVLFIPQIAIQVYTILDKTMIGTIISDKSEVGYYEQSEKIIKVLLSIVTSIGTVMLPRISNTYAKGDNKQIRNYLTKSFNVVFFLSIPMVFGIIGVSHNFVPMFFGDGYSKVSTVMNITCPILLIIGMSNVIGTQYLLPTKRQKEYTISVISGAVVNFLSNLVLIYNFGAIGAAIGSIIAEITVTFVQLRFVRKDIDFKSITKLSVKYLFSAVMMFILCLIIDKYLGHGVKTFFIQVICGALLYAVLLIILKDQFLFEIINRFFGKFKKKKEVKE